MSKVNFVSEFNSIMRYARDYSLSLRERIEGIDILIFDEINDDFAHQRFDGVRTITVSEKCTDTHNDFSKLRLPEYGYDAILRQSYFKCQPVFG